MGSKICPADNQIIQKKPENKLLIPINSTSVYNTKLNYLMSTGISNSQSQAHQSDHGFILKANKQGKLFTKYFLIYNFYISKYNSKEEQYESIYTQYMNDVFLKSLPEQKKSQFNQLLAQLKVQNQKGSQRNQLKKSLVVVNNAFKTEVILNSIKQVCLNTTNPTEILHVIFPLAELNNGINKMYHDKKKKYFAKFHEIYVIAELSMDEAEQLKEMAGKPCCFSFSIFVKGFTEEKTAKDRYNQINRSQKSDKKKLLCFFVIVLPKNTDKMLPRFDQGFYVNQKAKANEQNVLINIRNSFKVGANRDRHQFQLEYGYISSQQYIKQNDRASYIDHQSIQIFQISNAISTHYLKSQSWLMRILKQCENSTALSNTIIDNNSIDATRPGQVFAQNQVEVVNLINDYIDKCQYNEALLLANKYPKLYIIKAKKIEILFKAQRYQEASKQLSELGKDRSKPQGQIISQGEEIVKFISAKINFRQNRIQNAKLKLEGLRQAMQNKYKTDFQIVGRDLIKFIQEVNGKKETDPNIQIILSHSKLIEEMKDINLRGISTSI